jgi:hypothetical protein
MSNRVHKRRSEQRRVKSLPLTPTIAREEGVRVQKIQVTTNK